MADRMALTVQEAADAVGIGRTMAYKLCSEGIWPTIRLGKAVRIPVESLKRWLIEQQERGEE